MVSNQGAAAAGWEGAATHSNVAVRLDLIDPEAFLHQGARSAQQFFELPEGERSHLHHSHSTVSARLLTVGRFRRNKNKPPKTY